VSRWRRAERRLPHAEVQGYFDALPHRWLAFAFDTSRSTVEPHGGNFSVKFVLAGEERYRFAHGETMLRPRQVLVVNAGEIYSSVVDCPTRACSYFVPCSDVRLIHRALHAGDQRLLDSPDVCGPVPAIAPVALRLRPDAMADIARLSHELCITEVPDGLRVAELAARVTAMALAESLRLNRPDALSAVRRQSTRRELIARVLRAKDFVDDHPTALVSLDDLARVACLSKFHFLRVFTDVVGVSPAAYSRGVRLERARVLLARGRKAADAARVARYSSGSALRRALQTQRPRR
jgi:AraC family transcriptional regulator